MQDITIVGNLTRDPESGTTSKAGRAYCRFTVAVNDPRNKEADPTFWCVDVYNGQIDACLRYLRKGSKVSVSGNAQIGLYYTRDGEARVSSRINAYNVEFISTPRRDGEGATGGDYTQQAVRNYIAPPPAAAPAQVGFAEVVDDEDSPF